MATRDIFPDETFTAVLQQACRLRDGIAHMFSGHAACALPSNSLSAFTLPDTLNAFVLQGGREDAPRAAGLIRTHHYPGSISSCVSMFFVTQYTAVSPFTVSLARLLQEQTVWFSLNQR